MTESTFGSKSSQINSDLSKSHFIFIVLICVICLVALMGARYINLDADPSPDFIPNDSGYHIDEGYKTFAAKNLLVFGDTNWHEYDGYSGWMEASPLTQRPYYFAFKNLGLELESARLVSLLYFVLFIGAALLFLRKRYGLVLSLVAALLLATDPALFNFSRSAVFEIALVFFVYLGFLIVSRVPNDKPLLALVAFVIPALIAMFTVKLSAILYCVPAIVALSYLFVTNSVRNNARKPLYFTLIGVVILIGAYFTRDTWVYRIPLDAILYVPQKFLLNPMPDLSVLALLLGYACVLHLMLVKPKVLYDDLYRLSLTVTVVFTPIILALFKYNPPRYYVVIIPACLLLVIEWIRLRPEISQNNLSLSLKQKIFAILLFIPFSMFLLRALNILVLENIPFNIGANPGISLVGLYKLFPFFLLGLLIFVFVIRKKSVVALGALISVFVIVQFASGVIVQTKVLMNPSYESQKIRSALENIVTGKESVAGDWAPFFTAEAPIRSFYMSKGVNTPSAVHIANITPDYFLHSDSPFDPMTLELLESNDSITLSEPKFLGMYKGNEVQLYKLSYQ